MAQKRIYPWLLMGTIVAVVGLLTIQVVLIDRAYRAADRAFEQNVNAALQTVAQRLEAREIVTTVLWVDEEPIMGNSGSGGNCTPRIMMALPRAASADSSWGQQVSVGVSGGSAHETTVRQLREVNLTRVGAQAGQERVRLTTSQVATRSGPGASSPGADSVHFSFRFETVADTLLRKVVRGDSAEIVTAPAADHTRKALITRVIDRLSGAERRPVQARTDVATLDSLLWTELRANGITLDYIFGVAGGNEDTLRIAGPGVIPSDLLASPYRARLFPADILAARSDLLVSFPGARWYLMRQVGPYALATLLFAAIIVFAFLHAFRTIARQERLSVHVRDFINNMVHEFKTPLSTITLAAEAIVRPDVIGQRTRIRRYVNVIGEETARMRNGVSKILQMAAVEEGEYDLTLAPVDLHDLLDKVAAVFAVQIESRGGALTYTPASGSAMITADAMHLTNIVHNILENAVKYTGGAPSIVITTELSGATVSVSIGDNGCGIAPEEQERVFEKYYRVPTGNLHDVKGFGLGLAYVHMMVKAMQGDVTLVSTPGKGTTVTLSFPFREGGRG
jgi:two-component system, OmpR family, phosphate regulon sensor histidine kinase PhoR